LLFRKSNQRTTAKDNRAVEIQDRKRGDLEIVGKDQQEYAHQDQRFQTEEPLDGGKGAYFPEKRRAYQDIGLK
jgi:hypothetical protein